MVDDIVDIKTQTSSQSRFAIIKMFSTKFYFHLIQSNTREHYAKYEFSIKDFFSKSDRIHSFQCIWLQLLKES